MAKCEAKTFGKNAPLKDVVLKPCPFCGAPAELYWAIGDTGYNSTGERPEGNVEIEEVRIAIGDTRWKWKKWKINVHCTTSSCICRNTGKKFNSEDEAAEAWNRRV